MTWLFFIKKLLFCSWNPVDNFERLRTIGTCSWCPVIVMCYVNCFVIDLLLFLLFIDLSRCLFLNNFFLIDCHRMIRYWALSHVISLVGTLYFLFGILIWIIYNFFTSRCIVYHQADFLTSICYLLASTLKESWLHYKQRWLRRCWYWLYINFFHLFNFSRNFVIFVFYFNIHLVKLSLAFILG